MYVCIIRVTRVDWMDGEKGGGINWTKRALNEWEIPASHNSSITSVFSLLLLRFVCYANCYAVAIASLG